MFLVISIHSFAQVSYSTLCKIQDGKAYGYVNNYQNGFEVNGTVSFYFYDCNGRLIDTDDSYEYEYVSYQSSEEVDYTRAPDKACDCYFDIQKATTVSNNQNGFNQPSNHCDKKSYATLCEIRDGKAYGSINNYENSFEVNGTVSFYFYDCNGRLIDTDDSYEYEYVSSRSSEEIDRTSAPADACKCYFEVDKAIKN
jgi:hypothetical protein